MTLPRRLAPAFVAVAALAAPAAALADDCAIEGSYYSGRSALQPGRADAVLGTFAAGSEASPDIRTFTFGATATPRETELTSATDRKLSTPVFLRRADGTPGAVYTTTTGIVVAWSGADAQLLVPGITYGDFGNDVLGAAVAPDGTLTLAYVDPAKQLDTSTPPPVRLARFDAAGRQQATLDLPEGSAATALATVGSDGTTLIVGTDARNAYRWAPAATTLQPIALPNPTGALADDDALLPDGQDGAWLRTGHTVLHIGPASAVALTRLQADTTLVTGAGGNVLFGHGASLSVVAPSGRIVSDKRATGIVRGAGIVSVSAVAPAASGTAPGAWLLNQKHGRIRTMTLVRAGGRRTTITAKARNFTTDAQLALLPSGTAWLVWQDGRSVYDSNCDAPGVTDQSIQAARATPSARRAAPRALRSAHLSEATSL
jgi:hypothetical protein